MRASFDVLNPATGERVAQVPKASAQEALAAVEAARLAQAGWRRLGGHARADVLQRWFERVVANTEQLARLMVSEQGKPLAEARGEIGYAASYIRFYAEEARRLHGETIPSASPDRRQLVIREPVGVCAAITPWNFPAAMVTRKVAPALAAGCAMVLKPSELTPLTASRLAELALEAGVPRGVFQVVVGDAAEIGAVLTASPTVRLLSFTGSTPVGRLLMAQCAPTVKKLGLELGGNAPFIVFDDADLDAAVEGAIVSKFRNAGQTCVCANRFFVQRGVYDDFAARLTERVRALRTGHGLDDGVTQGPLINEAARRKALSHVRDAVERGARVATGGEAVDGPGWFMQPTVLLDVAPGMRCLDEETFGPVAPLVPFDDEAEAIAWANASEFGLASYFYSRDVARCFRVAEAIESGMVGINTGAISSETVPFGGIKQSGLGREGSRHGLDEYTELKLMSFGGIGAT
ncbi:NAD-dependent succinate-semialdehyde dehydrogenase [Mitsuaria sp. GD03876]|uniref:NAD-dependent succinate-semialdehyde dehydrogenase n=1 Tax=Mitsuaria sp. GD03876 TaxID=2975399 RepID=UPI002448FB31|nr:NAD-dependent succinate-semialdehyde dehydrogenase [Mitsuaria sp. GD03876]MDH0863157.1 NAD-dependent succinate-semialdehyde dehydrogenase [Mitsuaria sp. GD03876]